ncbi:MAG: lysoplasmalogenase [Cyclobacteriaceae bacterium]
MKKTTLVVFLLVGVIDLMALQWEWPAVHLVMKPLIMISLAIHYGWSTHRLKTESNRWTWAALGFSWLGDLLLLNQHVSLFFMLGLAAFLVAHISYMISYRQHCQNAAPGLLTTQKVRFALPVFLAGTGLVVVLYPNLGEFTLPVVLYAAVLMMMVAESIFRFGKTVSKSFWMVMLGAVLFMVSDSFIALNKFYSEIDHASLWIMLTYIPAQGLIIAGLLEHKKAASV